MSTDILLINLFATPLSESQSKQGSNEAGKTYAHTV